ncbi:MAG: GNAT family N-acetyltransferase [Alphaproteobacteria bacterium]
MTEMKGLQIQRCRDMAAWDAFVGASPQDSVFCRSDILRAYGVETDLWLVSRNGQPVLGLPVLHRNEVAAGPLPYAYYQGPVYAPSVDKLSPLRRPGWMITLLETALDAIEPHYRRLHFCTHPGGMPELRPLQWFHYHQPEKGRFEIAAGYTALYPLNNVQSWDGILESVRKDRRQDLKLAAANGLTVEQSKDFSVLRRLVEETFERQGARPDEDELQQLERLLQAATRSGLGELLVARAPGEPPVAAQLILYDSLSGHAVAAGNDIGRRAQGGGTLLCLTFLERCRLRGLRWADFNGANSPDRADFKHSLGAVPAMFFRATWTDPQRTALA